MQAVQSPVCRLRVHVSKDRSQLRYRTVKVVEFEINKALKTPLKSEKMYHNSSLSTVLFATILYYYPHLDFN